MGRAGTPFTPAVRALRAAGVSFTAHLYDDEGGAARRSRPGNSASASTAWSRRSSWRTPAGSRWSTSCTVTCRFHGRSPLWVLGVKGVHPCSPDVAGLHSGYKVQGTWSGSEVYSEHGTYMHWPTRAFGPVARPGRGHTPVGPHSPVCRGLPVLVQRCRGCGRRRGHDQPPGVASGLSPQLHGRTGAAGQPGTHLDRRRPLGHPPFTPGRRVAE